MTQVEPRSREQRKADTLAKLRARAADIWVASAFLAGGDSADSGTPVAYLVPLSLAWIDERIVIALESDSRTARNIIKHGTARIGLGPTRDVVIIDAVLDQATGMPDGSAGLAERYAEQAGWDPRAAGGGYVFLVLRPDRIQAWREVNELAGRTLMRDGSWVV